jgi:7-cyano-7-deazaguanine synthase in queuosine biosynthesis
VTTFRLRTDRFQSLDGDETLVLDWWPSNHHRSTVHEAGTYRQSVTASPLAIDFLGLAVATYCADKVALRADAADGFTRDLTLSIPVSDGERFEAARESLIEALNFLTGDRWTLEFRRCVAPPRGKKPKISADGVCLFSGGLDSLIGAIDLLAEGASLVLLGHHEGGLITHTQTELARELAQRYGATKVCLRQLLLTPARPKPGQARPLPKAREETTRSRSLLFIAAGIAIAESIGKDIPLYMPENGFIGINVPLVPARRGALSTRTTHPYFLKTLGQALALLGIDGNQIQNPYRLQTKGEMVCGTGDLTLLKQLATSSVSCAHPSAGRWQKQSPGNCGCCWPCLIRRASMQKAGWDRPTDYADDALNDAELLEHGAKRGASLRAMLTHLAAPPDRYAVLRNGSIPDGEASKFSAVYHRGCDELREWLDASAGSAVRELAEGA